MNGMPLDNAGKSIISFIKMFFPVLAFFICFKVVFELFSQGPFLVSEKDFVLAVFYSVILTFYFTIKKSHEKRGKSFLRTGVWLGLLIIAGAIALAIIERLYS